MGQRNARRIEEAEALSASDDRTVYELVTNLIPVVKKRITIALERSREDVEEEPMTLATLLVIEDHLSI